MIRHLKNICISFLFIVYSCFNIYAQQDSLAVSAVLDTMIVHELGTTSNGTYYSYQIFSNGELISEDYKNKSSYIDILIRCKPCYMKIYSVVSVLKNEGVRYGECNCGTHKQYYANGLIKALQNYKENDSGYWDNLYARGYCSVKDGMWRYYEPNGKLKKVENYKDNKLIE